MAPIFTVDYEDWNHGLHVHSNGHSCKGVVRDYLLPLLRKHKIKATFYVLGRFKEQDENLFLEVVRDGHTIASHGYWHDWGEPADRYPYFSDHRVPPISGGFFFRLFPLWVTKAAIKRTGFLFLHPHDLDENHPNLRNPIYHFKRHVGLKTARRKLERLLKDVTFAS